MRAVIARFKRSSIAVACFDLDESLSPVQASSIVVTADDFKLDGSCCPLRAEPAVAVRGCKLDGVVIARFKRSSIAVAVAVPVDRLQSELDRGRGLRASAESLSPVSSELDRGGSRRLQA
jgi:hypothetical protein